MDINITNACEFLRNKGLDAENYVIHDTSGYYKQQIALATWLEEYHQAELKKLNLQNTITSFCNCKGGAKGRTVTADFEHQICEQCGKFAK